MTHTIQHLPRTILLAAALAATSLAIGMFANADEDSATNRSAGAAWGPQWTADGKLKLPEDYHEWIFLGAPLTPHALNGGEAPFPEFHNVYVQPEAFHAYKTSGTWPEGTMMFKELQLLRNGDSADGSSVEVSGRGYFPGALNGVDVSVKDSRRFADTNGWGFFNFGHHAPPYAGVAEAQPVDACAGCHIANATDMVFLKFYSPILGAD
ncbi:MAG: cytochrome P460 family protein [Pseudomonadota bacterium]